MTGEVALGPLFLMLPVVVLLLAVEWASRHATRHLRTSERQIRCPDLARLRVSCLVVSDSRTGLATGVRRCTAFADPEAVRCGKRCVLPG